MVNILQALKKCGFSGFNMNRNLPVYLNLRECKKHFVEFIEEKMRTHPIDELGHITMKFPLEMAEYFSRLEAENINLITG